jgi:hypothetical protein
MSHEGGLLLAGASTNIYCAPHLEMECGCAAEELNVMQPALETKVFTEMRRGLRYRLDAPALFFWEHAFHMRLQGEGTTRDVSVRGAFIATATCPPVKTLVRVDLILPSLAGTKTEIRIQGEARVIRVQHLWGEQGENGFAVVRDGLDYWSLAWNEVPKSRLLERCY